MELEASRDLSKIWLHTDMDAFYAAVETLENPSLKGKPLAVGSMSMIATASYEVSILGYYDICLICINVLITKQMNHSVIVLQHLVSFLLKDNSGRTI